MPLAFGVMALMALRLAPGDASLVNARRRRYNGRDSGGAKMRAAAMRNKRIVVIDAPEPTPGPGEVIVKSLACGICGTDLHALKHAETMLEVSKRTGGAFDMDLSRDLVFGHEFCAELVPLGAAMGDGSERDRETRSSELGWWLALA